MTAPTAPPPQIVNFMAVANGGNNWEFSGDVQDRAPGGLAVALGGQPASLQGVTVTTDANGHFDTVITLQANGTDTGTATAQTTDAQGLQSNVASCMVNP